VKAVEWKEQRVIIRQGIWTVSEREDRPAVELTLVRAGQAGDPTALARLLALHKEALLAFCYGILGHVEDAEDAAQETFLQALRALSGYRGDAAFRTWLFRIAVRLCLRYRAARRIAAPLDEGCDALAFTPSPETTVLDRLHALEILRRLQPRHRAILLLKEREEWSVAEIAAALGWSGIRVKNELAKARRALMEMRRQDAAQGEDE
jgi:RNA polymerase sigma-70 factor (ECF subfamily)